MTIDTGIVIQARMGSTRLLGKVLMPIANRPLLGHVVERLTMLRAAVLPVVATTTQSSDEPIARWCQENKVACFRGSETDVLERYVQCARQFGFRQVVRLTADNPFTDIEELDRLIVLQRAGPYDYAECFGELPVGVGSEIFTIDALETSARHGLALHHREHVNEFILENPDRFSSAHLDVSVCKHGPELRLTVDTPEDYRLACRIAESCGSTAPLHWTTTQEAIAFCSHSA